jgi:hypothetical protein
MVPPVFLYDIICHIVDTDRNRGNAYNTPIGLNINVVNFLLATAEDKFKSF